MRNAFDNPLPGVPNIESPFFDDIFGSLDLPDEHRRIARDLRDHGFAVLDFPDPEIERIAAEIKSDLHPRFDWQNRQGGDGLRIQDAWTFDANVRRIATNPQIIALLGMLYGRAAWPFQTLNFPVGTEQHFHTDSMHFSAFPERFMCGVWVALEDIDEQNGPLVYYPGSHKWPIYGSEHIGVRAASQPYPPAQTPWEPLWQALVRVHGVEARRFLPKKGQALIWAANLLHGGDRHNDRDRTRWSQVTHYLFDDCAYYTPMTSDIPNGKVEYRRVPNICTGEMVDSAYLGQKVDHRYIKAVHPRRAPLIRRIARRGARMLGLA
jgi:hypothetical protein